MSEGDWETKKKDTVTIKNCICNQTWEKYIRTDLLGPCRGRFSLVKTCLSLFSRNLNPLYCLYSSLKPSFPTHSLQIHCIRLFRPRFIYLLCLGSKLCPTIGLNIKQNLGHAWLFRPQTLGKLIFLAIFLNIKQNLNYV